MSAEVATFILARHGDTEFAREGRHLNGVPEDKRFPRLAGGRTDVSLSTRGHWQAVRLATNDLHRERIHRIVTSGMTRTNETAIPLVEERKIQIIEEPLFRERDFTPKLERELTQEQLQEMYARLGVFWGSTKEEREKNRPYGIESDDHLLARYYFGLNRLTHNFPGETMFIAAHGDALSTFGLYTPGFDLPNQERLRYRNTAYCGVVYEAGEHLYAPGKILYIFDHSLVEGPDF